MCKLYSEQKAIRVKRIVDRKRTCVRTCLSIATTDYTVCVCRARLQPDGLMKPVLSPSLPPELTTTDHNGTEQSGEETVDTDNEEGMCVHVYILQLCALLTVVLEPACCDT